MKQATQALRTNKAGEASTLVLVKQVKQALY
jgi:hypothetical protein